MSGLQRQIKPSERLGSYEILEKIRSGGMATLYRARRAGPAGFAREVAVKVVHPHLAEDEKFVQMFLAEARLGARIQHPNIVHVEELGEQDGAYYLVMEYVHGLSLAQLLGRLDRLDRSLSPELAAYIAIEVAEALHAAHEATDDDGERLDVVHRDVSPQNILLAYDGHVKLIDFGVAKVAGAAKTKTGTLKGKLRYMSPEQVSARRVDRTTDIYALGIVLWELLTQRRRYNKSNEIELLLELRKAKHPAPSTVMPGCEPLDPVVLKALARESADRYPDARAFARALGDACPYALSVDAGDLASLVRSMGDAPIDDRSTVREQALGKLTRESLAPAEPVLEEETRSDGGLTQAGQPRRGLFAVVALVLTIAAAVGIGVAIGRNLAAEAPTPAITNPPSAVVVPAPPTEQPLEPPAPAPEPMPEVAPLPPMAAAPADEPDAPEARPARRRRRPTPPEERAPDDPAVQLGTNEAPILR